MSTIVRLELDRCQQAILDETGVRITSVPAPQPTDRAIAYADIRAVSKVARVSFLALGWTMAASTVFVGAAALAFINGQHLTGGILLAAMVVIGDGPLVYSLVRNQDLAIFPASGAPLRMTVDWRSPAVELFLSNLRERLPAENVQWMTGPPD